ncbi:hypothetical protein FBR06_05065 [Betaproteobacteria bacterium PRO4]|nr:hypothetical protein [Betaproteobacteria bacterium PRO4]
MNVIEHETTIRIFFSSFARSGKSVQPKTAPPKEHSSQSGGCPFHAAEGATGIADLSVILYR